MKPTRNLVLVVGEPDLETVRRRLAAPPPGIDLIELRIDRLAPAARTAAGVAGLVRASALPVLATCRPTDETGDFDGTDEARWGLLSAALDAGAALIDVEWSRIRTDGALARRWPAAQFLVSHHAPGEIGHAIEDELRAMTAVPSAGVKLVAGSGDFAAAMRLVELTRHLARSGRRATCFSCGEGALAGRILGYLAGAWLTYMVSDGDDAPARGVPRVSELLDLYRLPALGESVKLLGLTGNPLGHSLSPRMQNGVIRVLGERYLYLPFEAASVANVIDVVRRLDVRGLSVTRPHKESIIPYLDGLDPTAQAAGAVNTVVRTGARLTGWNTDLVALRALAREWLAGPSDQAIVIGAGGAARAVLAALVERQVPVILLNREAARGRALAGEFRVQFGGGLDRLAGLSGTILVQATPLGVGGEVVPLPAGLARGARVLDLAYGPGGTPLEAAARAAGLPTTGGHEFLARQGAAQFALWTRRLVSPDLFRDALGLETPSSESAC